MCLLFSPPGSRKMTYTRDFGIRYRCRYIIAENAILRGIAGGKKSQQVKREQ
ncbi:hypothetical protein M6B38_147245 [Iris pallida]|uniref:Uncharacterized protein n=1 Tax=Iris pallida TaxID=29817 RepID=A0AAX6F9R3_IRIPA|nr:hypothetical protein M6B38_147245 [Iris pallida]